MKRNEIKRHNKHFLLLINLSEKSNTDAAPLTVESCFPELSRLVELKFLSGTRKKNSPEESFQT